MRRIARLSLAVTLIAGLMLALAPQAAAAGPTTSQKVARRLMNKERSAVHRQTMTLDRRLSRVARRHSHVMASRNHLHHNPDLASAGTNRRWSRIGENVGVAPTGEGLRPTLRTLHRAFMASKPHRENILYAGYHKVGVGIARAGGRLWITVVFLA